MYLKQRIVDQETMTVPRNISQVVLHRSCLNLSVHFVVLRQTFDILISEHSLKSFFLCELKQIFQREIGIGFVQCYEETVGEGLFLLVMSFYVFYVYLKHGTLG